MNELITRCIEENAINILAEFPSELTEELEQELINFTVNYDLEFSSAPTLKRVMEEFDWFLPFVWRKSRYEPTPIPILDLLDKTINGRLISMTEHRLREARAIMEEDKRVPLEVIGEIIKLNAVSTGVHKFSTFDRKSYFTETALNLPFKIINSHIGGLSRGDFMLICGRLGSGKSTVAQFISKVLWQEGKKVLFISAEMLPSDVFARIDAMIGKFNPKSLRSTSSEMSTELDGLLKGVAKRARIEVGEIIIPKARLMTPQQIGAFARNLDVDVIVVDGTYLLRPSVSGATAKWEKVAAVSNELKQMALELQIPLIGTTQLKRGAGEHGAFTAEDISYSDALGQDADFLMMVNASTVVHGSTDLELVKNRYGGNCATRIETDFDTMTITETALDISKEEEEWITPMSEEDKFESTDIDGYIEETEAKFKEKGGSLFEYDDWGE